MISNFRTAIIGTGFISWDSQLPNQLWIGHRDQPNQLLVRDPALLSPVASSFCNYPGGHNEGFPDSHKQLFADFYRSIESGAFLSEDVPFPSFSDGHREIAICEAILASAREQRWIEVQY